LFDDLFTFAKTICMSIADKLFQLKNDKAATNLKAGQDFLETNKAKPGVISLPSGLQYEVITTGEGPKPFATNKVTCHYHGMLTDGTVFDSSVKRGQPATFPLNMVISGWTEGLQLMNTGSKWRFFIPPHLGYGERGAGAQIGPNSTLVFEVELLGIS
jgi:FKBP-type peptidyl-prolyl cis-trans isomerase FklB